MYISSWWVLELALTQIVNQNFTLFRKLCYNKSFSPSTYWTDSPRLNHTYAQQHLLPPPHHVTIRQKKLEGETEKWTDTEIPKAFTPSLSLSSKQIYANPNLSPSLLGYTKTHSQSPTVKSADSSPHYVIHSKLWPLLHIEYNALMWKLDVKRHVATPKSATVREQFLEWN